MFVEKLNGLQVIFFIKLINIFETIKNEIMMKILIKNKENKKTESDSLR